MYITIARISCAASFLLLLPHAGSAEPVKTIDIIDLAVDWADYVGQEVIVTGGRLENITPERGLLAAVKARGTYIHLARGWLDKEDLRWALRYCTEEGNPACRVKLSGVVSKYEFGEGPELVHKKIVSP